jgi:hypothetical protein
MFFLTGSITVSAATVGYIAITNNTASGGTAYAQTRIDQNAARAQTVSLVHRRTVTAGQQFTVSWRVTSGQLVLNGNDSTVAGTGTGTGTDQNSFNLSQLDFSMVRLGE